MKEIAHRAFAGIYPENTVFAVESAVEDYNPDMIEIDVQPCGDGIMVFHDTELERVTGLSGKAWQEEDKVSKAEIQGTGEPIPSLSDVLSSLPDEIGVNIELKNIDSEEIVFSLEQDSLLGKKLSEERLERNKDLWKPFAEKVLSTASEFENEILISSFFEGAIAAVSEVDQDVDTAFLFYGSIEEGLEVVEKYDCEAAHPPLDMIKNTRYFSQNTYTPGNFKDIDLIEKLHSQGRKVNVWTVENWLQAHDLKEAGVDGLITNYPLEIFASEFS